MAISASTAALSAAPLDATGVFLDDSGRSSVPTGNAWLSCSELDDKPLQSGVLRRFEARSTLARSCSNAVIQSVATCECCPIIPVLTPAFQ